MYEKQAQRLRGKSRYYKDQAIRYKQGYEDERLRTQQLKRHLEKETDAVRLTLVDSCSSPHFRERNSRFSSNRRSWRLRNYGWRMSA